MRLVVGAQAFGPDRAWLRLPPTAAGMRVGLLGGSFNPAHQGHRQASLTVLRRCGLDQVWWLVTPGNPLKDHADLAPLAARVAAAAATADHPRIRVTAFEAAAGLTFTVATIRALLGHRPGVRFVWMMGADNLAEFHRWRGWREIMTRLPLAVVDRPGSGHAAVSAPAARHFWRSRIDQRCLPALPTAPPPAWALIRAPLDPTSSSALRQTARHLEIGG